MRDINFKENVNEQDIENRALNSEYNKDYIANEKKKNTRNIDKTHNIRNTERSIRNSRESGNKHEVSFSPSNKNRSKNKGKINKKNNFDQSTLVKEKNYDIGNNVKEKNKDIRNNIESNKERKLRVRNIDIEEHLNNDQTDNLTLRALNKSVLKTKKIVRTTNNVSRVTIRTIKGSKKVAKEINAVYKNRDIKKLKPVIKSLKKTGKRLLSTSIKNMAINTSNSTLEALRNESNTENVTSQALYESGRNVRTTYNNTKRVINAKRNIKKVYKSIKEYKKNKEIKEITKNKINSVKKSPKISQKNRKVNLTTKDINSAQNKLKKNALKKANSSKKKYFEFMKKQFQNAMKLLDKAKEMAAAVLKNPKVLAIIAACILAVILIIGIFSAINSITTEAATTIPNVDNSEKWIEKMNKIDASASSKINSADEFRIENRDVQASWKDAIAVYMAKYYNDPPDINGTSSSTSTSNASSVTLGDSSEQTTFTGTYADLIKQASEKYGVDPNLIAAVIKQESDFNPNDVSSAGAMGLMQLMPENLPELGIDNAFDSYQNVMGGTQMLQKLCEYYNNDLAMVLMAYNLGQGNMETRGINSDSDIDKAPAETQNYVPSVIAYYEAYKNGTALPDGNVTGVIVSAGDDSELANIYNLFNTITVSHRTETSTHTNSDGSTSTDSKTITIVTLTKHNIDDVMKSLNFQDDQIELAKAMMDADAFQDVIPNFDFRFKIPGASSANSSSAGGTGAKIGSQGSNGSGKALSDAQFTTVKSYIDQCIGIPYQLGGSDPSQGYLDCSGFVSWVYSKAGIINGRYTAQGLCDISTPVNEEDLQPGDLVFFQDTYDCGDTVTHVGIYVGNGMMAHSGSPCQYTSFTTSYWQEHFYGYGRLT